MRFTGESLVRLMTVERPTAELESLPAERGFRLTYSHCSPEGKPVDSFFVHSGVQLAID